MVSALIPLVAFVCIAQIQAGNILNFYETSNGNIVSGSVTSCNGVRFSVKLASASSGLPDVLHSS